MTFHARNIIINIPPITQSGSGSISLALSCSLRLHVTDDTVTRRERTIIRGNGLKINITLQNNGRRIMHEGFVELLGRAISKSKLWQQLLFSASLEIPDPKGCEEDIILNLARLDITDPPWSPSAIENQIASHLPTEVLTLLTLAISMTTNPDGENKTEKCAVSGQESAAFMRPSLRKANTWPMLSSNYHLDMEETTFEGENQCVLDVLPILDTAVQILIREHLMHIAPCIFLPGYLRKISHSSSHIRSIAESIHHIQRCTKSSILRCQLSDLMVEPQLWQLMMDRVKESLGIPSLESLMNWGIENEHISTSLRASMASMVTAGNSKYEKPIDDAEILSNFSQIETHTEGLLNHDDSNNQDIILDFYEDHAAPETQAQEGVHDILMLSDESYEDSLESHEMLLNPAELKDDELLWQL